MSERATVTSAQVHDIVFDVLEDCFVEGTPAPMYLLINGQTYRVKDFLP